MATVSSLAMWFTKNSGNVEIVWLGWQISTTLSFFLLTFFILFFRFHSVSLFLRKIILFPLKIRNKIRDNKIKKAIALEEGLLASACDEKEKFLISYNKTKKNI